MAFPLDDPDDGEEAAIARTPRNENETGAAKAPATRRKAPATEKAAVTRAASAGATPAKKAPAKAAATKAAGTKATVAKATATKATATGTTVAKAKAPKTGATTSRKAQVAAGPAPAARARAPRKKVAPPVLERLVTAAVTSLEDDKAENVVVLDIATRSSFADRMIVATGLADRQIQAMATHVEEALEKEGVKRIRSETSPDWVLLDAGDLVIHLFKPEARETYAIERMWGPHSPDHEEASPAGEEG